LIFITACIPLNASIQRTLDILTAKGYHVQKVQGVDLFPVTSHTETVVLLSKLSAKNHLTNKTEKMDGAVAIIVTFDRVIRYDIDVSDFV